MRISAAVLLVSLTVVAQVSAARLPTTSERTALTRATDAYIHRDPAAARISLTSIRISSVDTRWASVVAHVWDSAGHQIQGATFVWHYVKSHWTLVNVGGAAMGCGIPVAVANDLALPCPLLVPQLFGQVRPAIVWTSGDGSTLAGGPDGDGRGRLGTSMAILTKTFGHIRWTRWTDHEAVGWAVRWVKDFLPCVAEHRVCPHHIMFFYKPASRHPLRIIATNPVQGSFRHLRFAGYCMLTHGYHGDYGGGLVFVSCRTWRPT